jgi:hypothetical protein
MTSPQSIVLRHQKTLVVAVGESLGAFDFDRDRFYTFDDIASDIWRRIEQPQCVMALIASLVKDYDGDEARIAEDVIALLNHLRDEGLLQITNGTAEL